MACLDGILLTMVDGEVCWSMAVGNEDNLYMKGQFYNGVVQGYRGARVGGRQRRREKTEK